MHRRWLWIWCGNSIDAYTLDQFITFASPRLALPRHALPCSATPAFIISTISTYREATCFSCRVGEHTPILSRVAPRGWKCRAREHPRYTRHPLDAETPLKWVPIGCPSICAILVTRCSRKQPRRTTCFLEVDEVGVFNLKWAVAIIYNLHQWCILVGQ